MILRAKGGECVLAGKHAKRRHPGADDPLSEGSGPEISGRVACRTQWSGAGYIQLLEETQRWAAQSSAQGLQQPAHKGTRRERRMKSNCLRCWADSILMSRMKQS